MANTVNSLNYANTFADWLVATDSLIIENNALAKGDYHKDSGVLYLDNTSGNSLETKGNVFIQQALLVQGTGSSATIDNNLTVKYGQVYFQNTTLGLTNAGQANINGLLVAQGPNTSLWVANNASIDGNAVIRYNTTTNNVQANTSVNTGYASIAVSTWTGYLQANNKVVTDVSQANTLVITDSVQANLQVNTSYTSVTNTTWTKNLQANTSTNTETSFANVSYAQYITANNNLTSPNANVTNRLYGENVTANNLQVNSQLTVSGSFVLLGDTIYDSNKFTINAGSPIGLNSEFIVNRGSSGTNSSIRFVESGASSYWDLTRGGGSYYRILTDEYKVDSVSNTSTISWATANSVWTAAQWASSAGSYANSGFSKANSGYAVANSAAIYANGAFIQANAAFNQANASYARANTSANVYVGTSGSVSHSRGVVSYSSNNGVTIVATTANNFAISTPQDLQTSASPTFASLSLTTPLAISQGGTGATTSTQALTNILPTGTTSGYVLTTGGPGNFYWAAAGLGGSGAIPGTTISSSRLSYTANGASGYTGNTFTIPQASASNQVRAYIDGVRQFESEYSLNLNANSISFVTTPYNGNKVLIEVDGYYVNPYYANNIAYTVNSDISPTASTIQLAIDSLTSKLVTYYANTKLSTTFSNDVRGITMATTASNTSFATTAFVQNLTNNSGTLTTNITGNAGSVTNGVYTSGAYSDPSWLTISKSKVGLGNVDNTADANKSVNYATSSGYAGYLNNAYAHTNGSDGWFRSNGNAGWYNETYLGGIFMEDTTWVKTYNSKALYVNNTIASTGDIVSWYSDERLKDRKGNITGALESVTKLNGFRYVNNELAKQNGYTSEGVQLGLSAQEVEALYPEIVKLAPFDMQTLEDGTIVSKSGENYKTLDYSKLVPVLVEAIKELKAEIDALKGNNK